MKHAIPSTLQKLPCALAFLFFTVLLSATLEVNAQASEKPVKIYYFWGDGCPHCAEAKPFLEKLVADNPEVELIDYEVWYNDDNRALLLKFASHFGFEASAVPTIFIGDRHWTGFNEQIASEITAQVDQCILNTCLDAGAAVESGIPVTPQPTPEGNGTPVPEGSEIDSTISLPLIGAVSLKSQSLLFSTTLIAFVDGFNPCSLWVLTMLLALVVHTGSRKKILIIGLVFLTVTAGVYALFIAGLFTMFTVISFVGWIQVVVALVALVFASINIKDYFWYKEGVSLTISNKQKPGLYTKMRNVLNSSQSIGGLVGASIVLAAGVSLVEFSCTAGFPVLWTNLLASQNVTPLTFGLLLAVYLLIYQIDELVIFFSVVYSLKASKLEEKQGRILKLVGGTLMLTLAIVMLVNPSLMNNLGNSLVIFGIAFAAAILVLVLHRKVLPHYGIHIGTEDLTSKKPSRKLQRRRAS